MKNFCAVPLAAFVTIAAIVLPAQAASFGSSVNVSADSDVLNAGSTALAFDVNDYLGNTGPTAVNGVSFSGSLGNLTSVDLALGNFPNTDNNGAESVSSMSANYFHILNYNIFDAGSGTPSTLTFSNLKANETYELQIFNGTDGVGVGNEIVSDGSASGTLDYGNSPSYASYIIESFTTMTNTSETIDITEGSEPYAILDAVNLRDIGEAPEPSTYALMLGGLAFLGFCVRRKACRVQA